MSNEKRMYDFEINGQVKGSFYATPKWAKKFINLIFESKYEGFVCEVSEDEDNEG